MTNPVVGVITLTEGKMVYVSQRVKWYMFLTEGKMVYVSCKEQDKGGTKHDV